MRLSRHVSTSLVLPLTLLCVGVSSTASAQEVETPKVQLYVGPMLGPHVKIKSWDLHETSEQGSIDTPLWPQLGVRGGLTLFSYVSLDAEVSYMTYASKAGARNHALAYRAGALGELLPVRRLSPFATAGFGAYHNVAGAHGMDLDMRTDYGFGARYRLSESWRARGDVRHVFTDGIGDFSLGHNLEILLSVEFTAWRALKDEDDDGVPDSGDQCPTKPGPSSTWGCPDTDGDGLLDHEDRCVDAPGLSENRGCPDTDGDKLLDPDDLCPNEPGPMSKGGCPTLDLDGDGIPDDVDVCVNVAEDRDGFQDEDGCPDLDNDGDGIADVDDRCPDDPETFNGVADRDGCPETDLDSDGVMDGADTCPEQPETINQYADFDGCPDEVPPEVLALDGVLANVSFTSDNPPKPTESSTIRLAVLVKLMKAHPSVRYTVTVYTPAKGDKQDNFFRSEREAKALRKYLLDKGIKSEHVQAVGGGQVDESASAAAKKSGQITLERF